MDNPSENKALSSISCCNLASLDIFFFFLLSASMPLFLFWVSWTCLQNCWTFLDLFLFLRPKVLSTTMPFLPSFCIALSLSSLLEPPMVPAAASRGPVRQCVRFAAATRAGAVLAAVELCKSALWLGHAATSSLARRRKAVHECYR